MRKIGTPPDVPLGSALRPLRPAWYRVPGLRERSSPLVVLVDDLEPFGLDPQPGTSWWVVRLRLDLECPPDVRAELLGSGSTPGAALQAAGLFLAPELAEPPSVALSGGVHDEPLPSE